MPAFLLAALMTGAAPPAPAPAGVWIEGETPASADATFQKAGWGRDVLSGKSWLFAAIDPADVPKQVPAGGLTAKYGFRTPDAGRQHVHARIGYEFARSPFRWRIDAGDWHAVTPDTLTTDLMALADFAEVAWLDLGAADLPAGAHTLEFNVPRPAKDRLLFGLDCVQITPNEFRPDGQHRPGERPPTPLDEAAAATVYEFPAPTGVPGDRRALGLGGTWQMARFDEQDIADRPGPVAALPADLDRLAWRGVRVPGGRDDVVPEWEYCHRFLYRVRVRIPADLAGRAFVLSFPNNALLTTVFVNGRRAGFSDTPCASYDCDMTDYVKPGTVNDIVVAIKDHYYAIPKTGDGRPTRRLFNYPPSKFHAAGGLSATRYADFPVLVKSRRAGILETPTLEARGRVYAADVFVRPSFADKSLAVQVTARNPGATAAAVQVRGVVRPPAGGPGGLRLDPVAVEVPAGGTAVVTLKKPWPEAVPWWPDVPYLYAVETETLLDGVKIDSHTTEFGFREWGIRGRDLTLNGVPWHGRADLRGQGPWPDMSAATEAVAEWRKNGQTMTRYWGEEPLIGGSQAATLAFFDRSGVPVRRSGIFDGEVASYQLVEDGKVNAPLFANWRKQLAAWVIAERNHPSVFIWSVENEVTYINARNFGWLKEVEPEIKKAVELVRSLDPTRPAMIDGGDALMDQSLAVAGNHYLEKAKRDYPDEAYTLARAYHQHTAQGASDPWPLPADRPLFLGESFFANGSPPAAYAEVMGEAAFLGRRDAARGVAKFARMLSEGYRWHGVAAFHFWFAEGPDAEHYRAWQPVAVLCREWDRSWPSGAPLVRTLKAFNDTRLTSPVTVHWLLQTRNTVPVTTVRGSRVVRPEPGGAEEFAVTLDLPAVPAGEAVEADLVLTCVRDGREVFRDVKPVRLFGPPARLSGVPAGAVGLFDPAGKAKELLAGLTEFVPVESVADLPAGVKVLVVGPDAVTPALSTGPIWTTLALKGVRVVVFDQAHPLHYQAIPADLDPTPHAGRLAFPEDAGHPVLAGLTAADLACWPGSHVVYRNAYRKPARGGRSLVQCDVELGLTPLVEVPAGDGVLLLSQLAAGDHPTAPAAQRLAANLVKYAWEYKRAARSVAVVLPENDPRRQLLAAAGLTFSTPLLAGAFGQADIVVVDGFPDTLAALAPDAVAAFTARGGQLVLWNVTPESLKDFNKLVGFDHVMRPFRTERVTLAAPRPSAAAGLGQRDVALESAEKIFPRAGDRFPAADTFTHVVDLADPAPFLASGPLADGWTKMTNGLTSADGWVFVFYHDQAKQGDRPKWVGTLPKDEEITGFGVVVNADYRRLTRVRLTFDNDARTAVVLDLKPEKELRQDFAFPARRCRTFAIEPLSWTAGSKPVIGIDNIWLTARRPADFTRRVVPLTNVGGLVWYPAFDGDKATGGGILLNQLRVGGREANPDNAAKKQAVAATLLKNLGAAFAAERLIVPGADLATTPVPLGDKCNAYLAADKWPGGAPGLAALPVGERSFAGVRYVVRDFQTSPLPAAVAVKPGEAVAGIPVGRTADALFFLHTAIPTKKDVAKDAPPVVVYTVRYADGGTAAVPVALGRGVGAWLAEPKPLPGAAVAWAAKAANDPAGRSAVLYQTQWTNPRPTVAIQAIDMAAPAAAPGTAVLLGVSAGTTK